MAEISNVSLVEEILIKASLTGLKQNFIDQKIDACMVSSLNDEELSPLGVQTIGERIRLRDAGKRIASQSQASLDVQPLQSQVGPLFFKTPRKCQCFGVSCEASGSQVFYLIDEEFSSYGKGANTM